MNPLNAPDQFLEHLRSERRASAHTQESYAHELQRWVSFLSAEFETEPLQAERGQVKRFIVFLSKSGLDPKSINRALSALRTFYKWCVREGHIEQWPMGGIRSLKTARTLVASVPEQDLSDLLESGASEQEGFEEARDRLILLLLYGLGLRRAELIGLKADDFHWERGVVQVLGKRNKQRQIPIPAVIRPYFDHYLRIKAAQFESSDPELLLTVKGKKLYPGLVYTRVSAYLKGATQVVNKNPHVLRHSYATHLLNSGVDTNTIKELLGHENLVSTQVYTNSSFEELVHLYNQTHPKGSKN